MPLCPPRELFRRSSLALFTVSESKVKKSPRAWQGGPTRPSNYFLSADIIFCQNLHHSAGWGVQGEKKKKQPSFITQRGSKTLPEAIYTLACYHDCVRGWVAGIEGSSEKCANFVCWFPLGRGRSLGEDTSLLCLFHNEKHIYRKKLISTEQLFA